MTRADFLQLPLALQARPSDGPRLAVLGVGNRGTSLLRGLVAIPGANVTAVCDLDESRNARAADIVQSARQPKPEAFTDYRRLLNSSGHDAVLIATPQPMHARMSAEALDAGKHVLSEVAAATTIDDAWTLVRAAERSGRIYMMAENCCYYRSNLAMLNMVRRGLFGDLTYAECGYVHNVRNLLFTPEGELTWRGDLATERANRYPTHAIGPVARWLGINRSDRFVSIVAMQTSSAGLLDHVSRHLPAGSPATKMKYAGDSTTALIRTGLGRVIEIRYDIVSARPHPTTTYYTLQGTRASYRDVEAERRIWIEGRSPKLAWEPFDPYQTEFDSDLWIRHGAKASQSGHGGSDYLTLLDFVQALRTGGPSPVDVYDAAAWSAIIPLTAASIAAGGAPQQFPDFTAGRRAPGSTQQ